VAGSVGTLVQVNGAQWSAGKQVLISMAPNRDAKVEQKSILARVKVDKNGRFVATIQVPEDERLLAQPTVWVVAVTADGRMRSAAPFQMQPVVAPVAPPGSGGSEAPPGPDGSDASPGSGNSDAPGSGP